MLGGSNPPTSAADPDLDQDLEVDAPDAGVTGKPGTGVRRQRRGGTGHRRGGRGWVGGASPWSANPGRGSRMKQACKVQRGVSHREREKRCGWNVGELGMLVVSGLAGLTPRRGKRPQGRRPYRHRPYESTDWISGPTQTRRTLEESQAHKRMNPVSLNGRRGKVSLEKPSRSARNGEASMGAA
jgi:hypothetical protein